MRQNGGMADTSTPKPETSKDEEEKAWREHVLDELHRISRALEKIADRVGGMNGA
jgi:hypothetical protein